MNNDLISREVLKLTIENFQIFNPKLSVYDVLKIIDNAPTVEPKFKPIAEVKFDKEQLQEIVDKTKAEVLASIERPHGEWIKNAEEWQRIDPPYFCSECGHANLRKTPFCEMCGADMRGGES